MARLFVCSGFSQGDCVVAYCSFKLYIAVHLKSLFYLLTITTNKVSKLKKKICVHLCIGGHAYLFFRSVHSQHVFALDAEYGVLETMRKDNREAINRKHRSIECVESGTSV